MLVTESLTVGVFIFKFNSPGFTPAIPFFCKFLTSLIFKVPDLNLSPNVAKNETTSLAPVKARASFVFVIFDVVLPIILPILAQNPFVFGFAFKFASISNLPLETSSRKLVKTSSGVWLFDATTILLYIALLFTSK